MEKQFADQIIEEYFHKIYGFAVKKSFDAEEVEELCSEMVKEVYLSLRKMKEIINMDGYIWRICENTFAKYVTYKKKKQGISLDGLEIPYYDEYDLGEAEEEIQKLRREIAFLTQKRRQIVYSFYYMGKSIAEIAREMDIPEGTVKWHLNKARNDLKEGIGMERKIGSLGLAPIEIMDIGHSGTLGKNSGPEQFLGDKINANIVYSVYWEPRTLEEIAQELGMTPVFIEDKVTWLEENGILVKTTGNRYTTYVEFTPRKVSIEAGEKVLELKLKAAKELAEKYVPEVRKAFRDYKDVYIPSGNRELFEATVIFYALQEKCSISIKKDLSNYRIRTLDGSDYTALVMIKPEILDPEYVPTITGINGDYVGCGGMWRQSSKYEGVCSWSVDSRLCSRKGHWQNNRNSDYDYVYELITGRINDDIANAEKFNRLRERGYITNDGLSNIMIVQDKMDEFFARVPAPDNELIDQFAKDALDMALVNAKYYPDQMQDYVVWKFMHQFIGSMVPMMVMDILYDNGTFRPLTEQEKVTSQLLMFCDCLPSERQ